MPCTTPPRICSSTSSGLIDAAAVLDHPEIEHADGAKVGIDLHMRGLDAVRSDIGSVARRIALDDFERRNLVERHRLRPIECRRGDIGEFHLREARPALTIVPPSMRSADGSDCSIEPAIARMFCLSFRAARKAASPPSAAPRDAQAPPPIGAVAGVAADDLDRRVSAPISCAMICIKRCARALALIGDAGLAADAAIRLERQPARFVRRNADLHAGRRAPARRRSAR